MISTSTMNLYNGSKSSSKLMKSEPDPSLLLLLPLLVSKPNCEVVSGNGNATKIPFSSRFSGSIMRSIWDVRWLNNEKRKRKKIVSSLSRYIFFLQLCCFDTFFSHPEHSVLPTYGHFFKSFGGLNQFSDTKKCIFCCGIKSKGLVILESNPNIRFFLHRKELFG